MVYPINIKTNQREEFYDITDKVTEIVRLSGVTDGLCTVFVPHTTAALTINENADPDVVHDILGKLRRLIPEKDGYRHMEGNSDAHLKASLMGTSEQIIIKDGKLLLGTWQGLYFTEFDGPRLRKVYVSIMGGEKA